MKLKLPEVPRSNDPQICATGIRNAKKVAEPIQSLLKLQKFRSIGNYRGVHA